MLLSIYGFGMIILNSKNKFKNIYKILTLLLSIVLYSIIFLKFTGILKTLLFAILLTLTFKIVFKSTFEKSILSSIIFIIILLIPDLITLTIAIYIFNLTKEQCYNTVAGGIISNISVSIIMIIITYIIRKPLKKLININISSDKRILITAIITIIFVTIFFYKFAIGYRLDQNVIIYIIAMIAFGIVLFWLLKQKIDNDKIAKKYDELLDIMKNYEDDIEEQRALIHETRNELTTIRCKIKDKEKNAEIIEYIDSIIGDKVNSNMSRLSKFKYLPSNGLKGFFYYKFTEAERKGINISVNISKQIENSFLGMLETKDFKDLVRIIGVYIDNAIEASNDSDEKKLGIEIYLIKGSIEIIISNTYSNTIDRERLGNERFSTKGKNRGHGLLFVKMILSGSKIITSDNEITNKLYIQKIKIKNNKKEDQ